MLRLARLSALLVIAFLALVRWEAAFRIVWRRLVARFDALVDLVDDLGAAQPDAGHTRAPVLLVGGYANDERVMGAIARSLERDGFRVTRVRMPEFGMGDLHVQKRVLRDRVARIRRETGADQVDLVGFSSGGFAARAAAQLEGGGHGIGRVVTIATGNGGFDFGPLNWLVDRIAPIGVRQVRRGSDLITALHDTRHAADVVSIGTGGFDGVVPNPSSYRIQDKPYLVVDDGRRLGPFSRVTHATICRDGRTYELVRSALLDQSAD